MRTRTASSAIREMRALNHAHQFDIPLRTGNGGALGAEIPERSNLPQRVEELGRLYLADGPTLLHGDFFPGSWLQQYVRVRCHT